MNIKLILLLVLISTVFADQCSVEESFRADCGYMGINQAIC